MKLDRNITNPRRGKYALIKLRKSTLTPLHVDVAKRAVSLITVEPEAIDFGDRMDTDFFVIRLKDKYAAPSLFAYADAALADGQNEYADEIRRLALDAENHPHMRIPD